MNPKISRFLRKISIGKYQTTLYTKSGEFYKSSSLGGIITIFIVIGLTSIITYLLINVFARNHYLLESSQDII